MRNTHALWMYFAAALMLGGVVSGQDDADRNKPREEDPDRHGEKTRATRRESSSPS